MMHEGKPFTFERKGRYKTVRLCEWRNEAEVRIEEVDGKTIDMSPEGANRLADWIKENVPSSDEIRLRFAEREAKEAVERLARLKRREAEEVRDEPS